MAIVRMSKFNVIFFSDERERLLRSLQRFKYVHFVNINDNENVTKMNVQEVSVQVSSQSVERFIDQTSFMIDMLQPYDLRKKGFQQLKEGLHTFTLRELEEKANTIQLQRIYEQTKEQIEIREKVEREINSLQEEITELQRWTDLHIPLKKLHSLHKCRIHIGYIPTKLAERFKKEMTETNYSYYDVITEDHQYTYFLIVCHKSEQKVIENIMMNTGFSKVHLSYMKTPSEEIAKLNKEITALEKQLQTNEKELIELAEKLPEIELLYDYYMLKKTRVVAAENFVQTEKLTMIEGYVPTHLIRSLEEKIQRQLNDQYYIHIEAAKEDDPNVPIMLENTGVFKAFESVTEMYALPKYNEIDPTPWFSIFYALFFGMMIGDAGYGLLMFVITFAILKVVSLTSKQRNFFSFFYYLSFSTIIWGAIFGSFFGDVFSLPALIDTGEQYNFLLTLSIVLGGIHVFFALGIQAYMHIKRGNILNALFDVGLWYMLLGGAIVYVLSLFLPYFVPYKTIGLIVMVIGMVGIVLTGGRHERGVGLKLAGGLYSLYGLSSYIGDFVSYSRLMALALASGFIAYAINLMVGMLFNLGWLGIVFGIVVFIIGQGFNLFLSILSTYVHTMRLTYVEFFGKFYEGGGKPFQLFRNASKYIEVK